MTSNIGGKEILEFQEQGGGFEEMKAKVLALLRQYFRPEFLNRVDETIVFQALEREQIGKITELLLERLARRVERGPV